MDEKNTTDSAFTGHPAAAPHGGSDVPPIQEPAPRRRPCAIRPLTAFILAVFVLLVLLRIISF